MPEVLDNVREQNVEEEQTLKRQLPVGIGGEVSGSHTRSGILGRVIFSDKEGRLYRDIDLKGIGYVV